MIDWIESMTLAQYLKFAGLSMFCYIVLVAEYAWSRRAPISLLECDGSYAVATWDTPAA